MYAVRFGANANSREKEVNSREAVDSIGQAQ